ncbi:MAG: signal peptidase I [Planctomycetota bacterium]
MNGLRSPEGRRRIVWVLLAAAGLTLAARATLFTTYLVKGNSMRRALEDGDRILVCDRPWLLAQAEPGDTVVVDVAGEVLVKRLVGLPGDLIAMEDGRVIRNGRVVAEAIPDEFLARDDVAAVQLAGDEFFVLGDNRRVSIDSRDFGPVHSEQIRGRVLLRLCGGGITRMQTLARTEP